MNVGCKLMLNDEAMVQFKAHTGKPATRLNVKSWAIRTLSENLGMEIETNFTAAQKKKLKKEMGKDTRMAKTKSADKSVSVVKGTTPTIFQRKHDDEPKRKKFTLRKK